MKQLSHSPASRLCAALALALAMTVASVAQAGSPVYKQVNLVSDGTIPAAHVDPNLVNAWGIAFNPFGAVWVANNHSGTSTLYDGDGNPLSLVVAIPTATTDDGGSPTGIVYNGSGEFVVTKGALSGPARFIFATEDGVIAAWAPGVDSTHALRIKQAGSAIYKGLAISANGSGGRIYATDFFNARIDVYDGTFQPVTLPPGAFRDPDMPNGFAPFGIQNLQGDIYVTYAKQGPGKEDDVAGPGLGFVDVYTTNGRLLRRVASRGTLNAPWGLAMAPAGFGALRNTLLVGNFGDGRINAFDPVFNFRLGYLHGTNHQPIRIKGLWGLAFGNGYQKQSVDTLYFTAGPDDETHGVYGRLDPAGWGY